MERPRGEGQSSSPSVNYTLPVSIKDLLEAGVHFGHKRRRWNPKMKPYIFTSKNKVDIIDIRKTLVQLQKAYNFVRDIAAKGGKILFVCTKKQGKDVVREEAERVGAFYVVERWPGGLLTNFETILTRIYALEDLELAEQNGTLDKLPKKEAVLLRKKMEKLQKVLGGIRELRTLPDLIYIVDTVHDEIALKEAKKLGIPVVAIVDTNADPELVDYPIPGNDDAIRSIKLITKTIADAVLEGKQGKDHLVTEKEFEKGEEE